MGENFRYAIGLFAGLAALLIIVAYYKGSTAVGQTGGSALNSLFLTAQGRTQSGTFPAYPSSGSGG